MTARELLTAWLVRQIPPEAADWLLQSGQQIEQSGEDAALYLAVSLVTRKLGRAPLALTGADLQQADACVPGWRPHNWTLAQAARLQLLLALETDPAQLSRQLDQLCNTADTDELVAFYRGLPLYPEPHRYVARAREGLRSNIRDVFEAVALDNPYPAAQLDEPAWNQMILKALFTGSPLQPVIGLDARRNAALAAMLCDYAHERWAARRPVSPELWRCVGPYASGSRLDDLSRVLETGLPAEQCAAALALYDSPDAGAAALLQRNPALQRAIEHGELSWNRLQIPEAAT